ncbi:MAG: TetR/AcrR family transcriptional regulator [bacterium]|nr:TetR/AcrR family transcriptional regulator [bacterium]
MRGYQNVGVSELCTHAGVKKGSFYYFFRSKEELALAVVDAFWQDYEARLDDSLAGSGSPLSRLERFLDDTYLRHRSAIAVDGCVRGCLLGNLALELATTTEMVRDRVALAFGRLSAALEVIVGEAMASGEVPEGDPHLKGEELLAYIEGIILLAKARNNVDVIAHLRRGALALLGVDQKNERSQTE